MRKPASAAEFIKAWQTSDSLDAVALQLNMTKAACSNRAAFYRTKTKRLRSFPVGRKKMDEAELDALVAKFA